MKRIIFTALIFFAFIGNAMAFNEVAWDIDPSTVTLDGFPRLPNPPHLLYRDFVADNQPANACDIQIHASIDRMVTTAKAKGLLKTNLALLNKLEVSVGKITIQHMNPEIVDYTATDTADAVNGNIWIHIDRKVCSSSEQFRNMVIAQQLGKVINALKRPDLAKHSREIEFSEELITGSSTPVTEALLEQ